MSELNLDIYKVKLEEKGLSKFQLIKLTGIPKSTIYAYFSGKVPLTKEVCAILADAIHSDVTEVFPELIPEAPSVEDVMEESEVKYETVVDPEVLNVNRPAITVDCMTADAATLVPDDGFTVKSRKVLDHLGTDHDALSVQPETQVIIRTGVKVKYLDMDKLIVHGLMRHIMENECRVLHTPLSSNGELCIVMYVHGKPLMVCRGKEVAQLVYI